MIESKIKRQALTDAISHWCNHVKATPVLRQGDIEGLVKTILEEFYSVTLACGHKVRSSDEGITIAFKDCDGVVYGGYCPDCAKRAVREGAWEVK